MNRASDKERIQFIVDTAKILLAEATKLAPEDETYHVAHVTKKDRAPFSGFDYDFEALRSEQKEQEYDPRYFSYNHPKRMP